MDTLCSLFMRLRIWLGSCLAARSCAYTRAHPIQYAFWVIARAEVGFMQPPFGHVENRQLAETLGIEMVRLAISLFDKVFLSF
jgi:hypothetical protein